MTTRDRMVLIGCVVAAVLAGAWIKVVSPERQKASKLSAQVSSAQSQLQSADGKLASARAAESQYPAAYSAMVNLGKAVPPTQEVPSLMYEVAQATAAKRVDFSEISTGASGTGSTTVTAPPASKSSSSATSGSSTSSSAAGSSATASSAGALTQVPFTFVFEGTYFDLERLLSDFTSYTTRTTAGTLQVSGRLLTVQSVKLNPANSSGTSKAGSSWLTGTITATAYTAPAPSAALLSSPSAASTASGTSAASSAASPSSATAPAVVKVTP